MTCDCRSHNGFLTAKGLEEAAQRSSEGLEALSVDTRQLYLDIPGSVSGLRRDETVMIWNEEILDEQYSRHFASPTELVA